MAEAGEDVLLERSRGQDQLALKDRALAATAEGITIGDASRPGNPIIYANEGFERLTGYGAEEILGRNCRFLQGPDTDPEAIEEIRRALRQERDCKVEILNYRKDGTPFWNRLSITPVRGDGGRVTHYIGIQSDVSARRRAEERLRAAKQELELANHRMRRDLEAAARIQRSLLPAAPPRIEGLRIAWRFEPCDPLAGDTLNVFPVAEGLLGLYVLDVSGHGVPAALLSVTLSHWLSPRTDTSCIYLQPPEEDGEAEVAPPAAVLEALNQQFPFDARTGQYFTMVYATFDLASGELRYAIAAHPPPVYLPRGGRPVFVEGRGFPVGIVGEPRYAELSVRLEEGDRLFLYTDGLVEAQSPEHRELGEERLLAILEATRETPLDDSLGEVLAAVESWRDGAPLEDDYSILALERTAPGES